MADSQTAPSATSLPTRKRAPPQALDSKTFRDGAIYLYRRADYKRPTWFIRLKIPGAKGYVWKSSGTTDEHAAYGVAEQLYNQSLVKVLGGGKLPTQTAKPMEITFPSRAIWWLHLRSSDARPQLPAVLRATHAPTNAGVSLGSKMINHVTIKRSATPSSKGSTTVTSHNHRVK